MSGFASKMRSQRTGSAFVSVRAHKPLWRGTHAMREGRRGQVAVEWLMLAGILTAVAILLTAMFQPVLVGMVRALARAVRTPGL